MGARRQHSYPDLLRVVYRTFDSRQIAITGLGLFFALLSAYAFSTLAYFAQGSLTFLPWFLNLLGAISFYLVLIVFSGPVTYLALQENTGGGGGLGSALRLGIRYGPRLLRAPLSVLSSLLLCLILLAVLISLGLLPRAGTVIWSLLIVPQFLISLFIVIGVLTLLAGTLLLPSIIIDREIPARRAFQELTALIKGRFFTFWGYIFTILFLTAAYFAVATIVLIGALSVFFALSASILGDMPGKVIMNIPPFFHKVAPILETALPMPSSLPPASPLLSLSGAIAGFSLLIIYVIWLSYPVLYAINSGVVAYLALTRD
jgi:hypothetical protein